MLEGLSNPPVFNQSKLIYLQHTSGIDLYNMYIYARGKKNIKANDVIVEQAGFIDLVLVLPCLV